MPIKNGHSRRHVTALKMGHLPIFNLHGSKECYSSRTIVVLYVCEKIKKAVAL